MLLGYDEPFDKNFKIKLLKCNIYGEQTNEYETNEFISCTRSTTVHLRMLQMLAIRFNQSVSRSVGCTTRVQRASFVFMCECMRFNIRC